MKKTYQEPEIIIETFAIEDVITTSGDPLDEDELIIVPNSGNN